MFPECLLFYYALCYKWFTSFNYYGSGVKRIITPHHSCNVQMSELGLRTSNLPKVTH